MSIAELISPDAPRWFEFLSRVRHDVYHLPEYVALSARHEGGTPLAFYAENEQGRFLIPMVVRRLPDYVQGTEGWQDASSPYGYPSLLTVPSDDSNVLEAFLLEFRELAADHRIVSMFFRLHPLLRVPYEALTACGQLVLHGQTVSMDLSQSAEGLWRQTRENHRRGISKLTRNGFTVEMDQWEYLDDFIAIYRQAMERIRAEEHYFFDREYFVDLQAALGSHLHLCTVLSPEGDVAAAGLFTTISGIGQYHLGASSEQYRRHSPLKLMLHHVSLWAQEAGCHVLHLGGGVGGRSDDSLFHFKAGFSGQRHDFYTFRMVIDESSYTELCRRWREQQEEEPDESDDFFPLYRRPLKSRGERSA